MAAGALTAMRDQPLMSQPLMRRMLLTTTAVLIMMLAPRAGQSLEG
jgi:hypothetical protein